MLINLKTQVLVFIFIFFAIFHFNNRPETAVFDHFSCSKSARYTPEYSVNEIRIRILLYWSTWSIDQLLSWIFFSKNSQHWVWHAMRSFFLQTEGNVLRIDLRTDFSTNTQKFYHVQLWSKLASSFWYLNCKSCHNDTRISKL